MEGFILEGESGRRMLLCCSQMASVSFYLCYWVTLYSLFSPLLFYYLKPKLTRTALCVKANCLKNIY